MDAPPSKGPSVSLPQRADSWALLRLSIFPASRQLTALSCETEFPNLMFRVCTIYLVAYRGFIGIRRMIALIKGARRPQTPESRRGAIAADGAALIMSRT